MNKEKKKYEHQPRYGIMLIGIVSVVITFFIAWELIMGIGEYSISGTISEVMYKDNGFASDSVKVFFRNQTGYQDVLEIKFNANTYYNFSHSGSDLDRIYQLLKSHIGDEVTIEYTKAPIGEVGFKSLSCR